MRRQRPPAAKRPAALAIEVEHLARLHLAALALGEPPRLAEGEMAQVIEKFSAYGQPQPRR